MKHSYKISKRNTLISIKYLLAWMYCLPIFALIVIPLAHYRNDWSWNEASEMAIPVSLASFLIFGIIPTLVMHLLHYLPSKNLQVEINLSDQTITFQKEEKHVYSIEQLQVTQHLSILHKNKVDKNNRIAGPWSNYSFLALTTPDNKRFNISSLILNQTEFPVSANQTEYDGWPSFSTWLEDVQHNIDEKEAEDRRRIAMWKEKFNELSSEELKKKLSSPEQYADEPKLAMEELLKEKAPNRVARRDEL